MKVKTTKIIFIIFLLSVLIAPNVFAAQEQHRMQAENTNVASVEKVNNAEQLRQQIQLYREELKEESKNLRKQSREILENQNSVREAVHAFLASEDLVGGIGQQVSQIAQGFNNSVDRTVQAENSIRNRNWWQRLWNGGDEESGLRIKSQVDLNAERLEQLKELYDSANISEELKEIISEHINNIETEMERLDGLANREIKFKGIWGWIKGIFGA